jgi:phospholipase/carboxylesterase
MHTQKATYGDLTSFVVHDLAAGEKPMLAVVLCHGYGAPGTDLVGLAEALLSAAPVSDSKPVLIFPAAPLDLAEQGLPGGRAWWPVDLDRLINRRTPEVLAQFRRGCPSGLPEARDRLLRLLNEAGKQFGLTADRFVLGGFSQGAMLATDVALRLKKSPAGLCILSGALTNEDEWRRLAAERGPLRVLQSHGRHDSILPFMLATPLRDLLVSGGAAVDFFDFDGDHEIPLAVLHRLAHFIGQLGAAGTAHRDGN